MVEMMGNNWPVCSNKVRATEFVCLFVFDCPTLAVCIVASLVVVALVCHIMYRVSLSYIP
jgi:hypothetical protein